MSGLRLRPMARPDVLAKSAMNVNAAMGVP
jgi:hypothetical protein